MRRTASAFCLLLVLSGLGLAQQNPDFSGVYTSNSVRRSDSTRVTNFPTKVQVGKTTLKVVQAENSLEAAFTFDSGKTGTRRYALDGSETENVDFDGTPTTDRVRVKGRTLVIRSIMTVRTGDLKDIPVYSTQKWELSPDLKTLTVYQRFQVQGMHMMDDALTTIYVRQ